MSQECLHFGKDVVFLFFLFRQWYFKTCTKSRIPLLAAELFQLSKNCEESSSLLAVSSCR